MSTVGATDEGAKSDQDRRRVRRGHAARIVAEALLAIILVLNALLLVYTTQPGDWGTFVASGRAAREGLNPYGVYPLTSRAEIDGATVHYPNLNPPVSLLFLAAIPDVDPMVSFRVWVALSAVLYLTGIALLRRAYGSSILKVAWALSAAGIWNNLILGQIYVPLFLSAAVAWLCLSARREGWAGILIGLVVAIKPNLGLWPVMLLLAGHRRAGGIALLVALGISALPVLRYGPGIYTRWLEAIGGESWFHMPHYASLPSLGARLGLPSWGIAAAVVVAVGALAIAWRRRPPALRVSELALLTVYLVSPSSSPRLGLFLVPALLARPWTARTAWAAGLLTVPAVLVAYAGQLSAAVSVAAGMVYPAALVLLAVDVSALLRVAARAPNRPDVGCEERFAVGPAHASRRATPDRTC